MRARRWTRVGRRSRGARRETYTTHENAFARVVDIDSTATRWNDPTVGGRAGASVSRMRANACMRADPRAMRARRVTRATSIERIKNTRMHASRRCRRHRSRQTRVRLDSIVPIRPAYLPSSADTIETRSIDRRGHDAARETRRRRATRGDAPGDGGGRELRGRGHGWRETSTSADDDDDDDDDDEDEEEADEDEDDRPLDRPTGRRAGMGGPPVVPLMGVRTSRLRVRVGGVRSRRSMSIRLSSDTRYVFESTYTV